MLINTIISFHFKLIEIYVLNLFLSTEFFFKDAEIDPNLIKELPFQLKVIFFESSLLKHMIAT